MFFSVVVAVAVVVMCLLLVQENKILQMKFRKRKFGQNVVVFGQLSVLLQMNANYFHSILNVFAR